MKVLVATASSNLQKLICRRLQRSGYTTDEVDSAAAALEAARSSEYKAVVTDMHLPDCCGATLVNRMREAGVATPAILLVEAETPPPLLVALNVALPSPDVRAVDEMD